MEGHETHEAQWRQKEPPPGARPRGPQPAALLSKGTPPRGGVARSRRGRRRRRCHALQQEPHLHQRRRLDVHWQSGAFGAWMAAADAKRKKRKKRRKTKLPKSGRRLLLLSARCWVRQWIHVHEEAFVCSCTWTFFRRAPCCWQKLRRCSCVSPWWLLEEFHTSSSFSFHCTSRYAHTSAKLDHVSVVGFGTRSGTDYWKVYSSRSRACRWFGTERGTDYWNFTLGGYSPLSVMEAFEEFHSFFHVAGGSRILQSLVRCVCRLRSTRLLLENAPYSALAGYDSGYTYICQSTEALENGHTCRLRILKSILAVFTARVLG